MDNHKNFSYSLVATAPSPATSGTTLVVTAGQGTLFPTPPFNATVWAIGAMPLSTNAEIVRVTGISTDTLTIVRTQESSSVRTIIVGDQIAATITAKVITDAEIPNASTLLGTTLASNITTSSLLIFGSNPILGVASATSINKVNITQPATGSTLTILNDKTASFNNSITFTGTDSTTMTFPATSASIARIDAAQTFTGIHTFTNFIIVGQGIFGAAGLPNNIYHRENLANGIVFLNNSTTNLTSGNRNTVQFKENFAPTSGNCTLAVFGMDANTVINQSGSATGITRGIYIAPTLTSASDWRAIEIASNSGFGINQTGASATNAFAGTTSFTGALGVRTNMIFPNTSAALNILHRENIAIGISISLNNNTTLTGSTRTTIALNDTFSPTSGTATFALMAMAPIINQSGSANGITRGWYLNPTLTSAFDWRSIEIANNSGYGIYQSGASTKNYFAGSIGIGVISPAATALLDLTSTTKALKLMGMTKTQRDAIATPQAGYMVYQNDNTPGLRVYNGSNWMRFTETID